ncbi:MAG: 30S ribosomal protein S10 [Chlamydiia bacterium]|nr:30S ribosomal protein S10 [Chlamydiia bacterium]
MSKKAKKKIQIRLQSYDHALLDRSVSSIIETAKRSGAVVAGPVPLPTQIDRVTVLRSPHVDKKSREQFETRTHKRAIYITDPAQAVVDSLRNLTVPAGVDVMIKMS